jgi:hypothetical protein
MSEKEFGYMLGIIGIFIAALTFFGFQILKDLAANLVKAEVSKVQKIIEATADFTTAWRIWDTSLEEAIELSEAAIGSGSLDGKVLLQAKSNLAYYYAYKPYVEMKKRALSLAEESLELAFLYPDRTTNFKINYGYVIMRYANSSTELDRALRFLEHLLLRPDLRLDERQEIEEYLTFVRNEKTKYLQKEIGNP